MFQQATKPRPAGYRSVGWQIVSACLRPVAGQRLVAHVLVGPLGVVMLDPLRDQVVEMVFAEHDEVVQALLLDALHPSFDEGVHVCRSRADFFHLCAAVFDDFIEVVYVFPVEVANKLLTLATRCPDMLDERLGLFLHPLGVRLPASLADEDCTAANVNERQNEILPQTRRRPDPLREEVALIQSFRVHLHELGPTPIAGVGAWSCPASFMIFFTVFRDGGLMPSFLISPITRV